MRSLETLAKDCNFAAVTTVEHTQQSIRTAFVSGLQSNHIRQRLLEESKSLVDTFDSALTLESAMKNTHTPQFTTVNTVVHEHPVDKPVATSLVVYTITRIENRYQAMLNHVIFVGMSFINVDFVRLETRLVKHVENKVIGKLYADQVGNQKVVTVCLVRINLNVVLVICMLIL